MWGLGIANWIKDIARSSRHSLGIKVQFPTPAQKPKNNSPKHTKIIQIIRQGNKNAEKVLGQKLFTQKQIAQAWQKTQAKKKAIAKAAHGACLAFQVCQSVVCT